MMAKPTGTNIPLTLPPILPLNAPESDSSGEDSDSNGKKAGGGRDSTADAKKKATRRRSSKACDNCRKSKCKCTRDIDPQTKLPSGPCQNCVAVGTECTFLGASRKRGPPKGYIEAIESRLHRMEALLGGLLQNDDPRAQALLGELIGDEEAREILTRDLKTATSSKRSRKSWKPAASPTGEAAGEAGTGTITGAGTGGGTSVTPVTINRRPSATMASTTFKTEELVNGTPIGSSESSLFPFSAAPSNLATVPSIPSNSWDSNPMRVVNPEWTTTGNALGFNPNMTGSGNQWTLRDSAVNSSSPESAQVMDMDLNLSTALVGIVGDNGSPNSNESAPGQGHARQRRRLNSSSIASPFVSTNSLGPGSPSTRGPRALFAGQPNPDLSGSIMHTGSASYSLSKEALEAEAENPDHPSGIVNELSDVVGQLSLNENAEVRYHGRSSGLYLISRSHRYKDFFWQFPSTGFWPPTEGKVVKTEEEVLIDAAATDIIPDRQTQDHLLDLYMTYVHPHFPILYKPYVVNIYRAQNGGSGSNLIPRIPALLLLCIFALSSRYSDSDAPRKDGKYWTAGENYYDAAKRILNQEYGSTKLVTVQALLLMAYRQIGIGAMSESWLYTGMAIRMAQDLGLHRDVDKWFMPISKFTYEEKQARKRVWWACIVLDKYVSTYIGRPMAIFERDYDTALPNEDEPDEHEQWHPLRPDGTDWNEPPKRDSNEHKGRMNYPPTKSYSISCFNAAGNLSSIISRIIVNLYAIRTRVIGQSSANLLSFFDQNLANWFLNLPPHLTFNPTSKKVPPPHILCLHAQFYCALILLHRPFIPGQSMPQVTPPALPSHSICTTSANAISNIVSIFDKTFTLRQCPPFMTYPIFTAGIMHVYNTTYDPALAPTAKINLQKCMTALKSMELTWGSAIRAWELLSGLVDMRDLFERKVRPNEARGTKRGAEDEPSEDFNRQTTFHTRAEPRRNSSSRRRASRSGNNTSNHMKNGSGDSRPSNGGFVFPPESPFTYEVSLQSPVIGAHLPVLSSRVDGFQPPSTSVDPPPTIRSSSHNHNAPHQTFEILGIDSNLKPGSPSTTLKSGDPSPSFTDILNNFTGVPSTSNLFGAPPLDSSSSAFFGLPLGGYLTEEWEAYLPQAFLSPTPSIPVQETSTYPFATNGTPGSDHPSTSVHPQHEVEPVVSQTEEGNVANTS